VAQPKTDDPEILVGKSSTEMFNTVGVFGKYKDAGARDAVSGLVKYLSERDIEVWIGPSTAEALLVDPELAARVSGEDIFSRIDLGIVLGGDGTLLHVARDLASQKVPVIGINMGRLGFLTDIPLSNMYSDIGSILEGNLVIEERMMLCVEILRDDKVIHRNTALNDVVLGRYASEKMIEWHSYIDGKFVTSSRSDGVIVATPTGSTAYALSAGGPIMAPSLDAIVMVPICPHTLSNRPIALQGTSQLEFRVLGAVANDAQVSVDGQVEHHLAGDEIIRVRRAEDSVKLVRPPDYDHFATLRAKLGWGENRNVEG
jgi:NAD+ kinase